MIHPLVLLSVTFSLCGAILLVLFPDMDLRVSSIFYQAGEGFIYTRGGLSYQIYFWLPTISKIFGASCIIYLIIQWWLKKSFSAIWKAPTFMLLIAFLLGPALLINYGLKEHFDRARPKEIREFGGEKIFSPAFKISNQCSTNCSFSSGHAAIGFYVTIFAYLANRRRFYLWYGIGLLFGIYTGLSRILTGAHFLSDILASALIVLLLDELCYRFWQKYCQREVIIN